MGTTGGPATAGATVKSSTPGPASGAELGTNVGQAVKSALNLNSAYSKLAITDLPTAGNNQPWLLSIATALAQSSGFFDEIEIPWIKEIKEKKFEELGVQDPSDRLSKANMQLAMVLDGVVAKNNTRLKHHLDMKKEKTMLDHARTMKGREVV
eukprot:7247794-Alexandrium_andersonii.AAC.1